MRVNESGVVGGVQGKPRHADPSPTDLASKLRLEFGWGNHPSTISDDKDKTKPKTQSFQYGTVSFRKVGTGFEITEVRAKSNTEYDAGGLPVVRVPVGPSGATRQVRVTGDVVTLPRSVWEGVLKERTAVEFLGFARPAPVKGERVKDDWYADGAGTYYFRDNDGKLLSVTMKTESKVKVQSLG